VASLLLYAVLPLSPLALGALLGMFLMGAAVVALAYLVGDGVAFSDDSRAWLGVMGVPSMNPSLWSGFRAWRCGLSAALLGGTVVAMFE
jgi:hypothetical protein